MERGRTLFNRKPPLPSGLSVKSVRIRIRERSAEQPACHHDAASGWRAGCARSEPGEAEPRSEATPATASPRQPERCRAREPKRATGRSCRRKGKWPRRLHRRRTLGANCPAALGAVFEVTAFDGWSLRSPAKMALETWPGWRSASEARPNSVKVSRHWKKLRPKIQTLENATAAKARRAPAFSRSQAPH